MSATTQLTVSCSAPAVQPVTYAQASTTAAHLQGDGLTVLRAILKDAIPKNKPRHNNLPDGDVRHSWALLASLVVCSAVAFV